MKGMNNHIVHYFIVFFVFDVYPLEETLLISITSSSSLDSMSLLLLRNRPKFFDRLFYRNRAFVKLSV